MEDFDADIEKLTKSLEELDQFSLKKVLEQKEAEQRQEAAAGRTPSPTIATSSTSSRRPPSTQPPPPVETPARPLDFSSPYATATTTAHDFNRYSREELDYYRRFSPSQRFTPQVDAFTLDPHQRRPVSSQYTDTTTARDSRKYAPAEPDDRSSYSLPLQNSGRSQTTGRHHPQQQQPSALGSKTWSKSSPPAAEDDNKSRASTLTWQELDSQHGGAEDPERKTTSLLQLIRSLQETLERQEKLIARLQQENHELRLGMPGSSTMTSSQLPPAPDYGLQWQRQRYYSASQSTPGGGRQVRDNNRGRRGGSTANTPASKFISELTQLMGNIDPEYKESLSLILDKHWEEVEEIRRRHQWTR